MPILPVNNRNKKTKIKNRGIYEATHTVSKKAQKLTLLSIGSLAGLHLSSKISQNDSVVLNNAAQKGLNDTGLAQKGVKIFKMEEVNLPGLKQIFNFIKENKKNTFKKLAIKCLDSDFYTKKDENAINAMMAIKDTKDKTADMLTMATKESYIKTCVAPEFKFGLNAAYFSNSKTIITPDKHIQTSVFHEMGHALNDNGGKLLKNLQKARIISLFVPAIILFVSMHNKRKTTDPQKQNDSIIQRSADFIKRNAKKLTVLSMLPMVAEEGLASIRGEGIARKLLKEGNISKSLFAKAKIGNLFGFSSYVLAALISSTIIDEQIKVKDKVQQEYEDSIKNGIKPPKRHRFRFHK